EPSASGLFRRHCRLRHFASHARSLERPPRVGSSQLSIGKFKLPVYEYELYALRQLGRLGIGSLVGYRGGIEDGDVREEPFLDHSAIGKPLALCWKRSDLPDCLFQGDEFEIANIVPQKARHASKGARMPMGLKQKPVQRCFAGVQPNARPRLLQSILQVI